MLNNGDKKTFKDIVRDSLQEFFNTHLLPYFERSERSHKEIFRLLDNISKKLDKLAMKLDRIQELQEFHTALNSSPRRTKDSTEVKRTEANFTSDDSLSGEGSIRGRFKNSEKLVN